MTTACPYDLPPPIAPLWSESHTAYSVAIVDILEIHVIASGRFRGSTNHIKEFY